MSKKLTKFDSEGDNSFNSSMLLESFLKDNKKDHLYFEDPTSIKISSGSLILDTEIGGSLPPGVHSVSGISGGGKSSCCLSFAEEFLKEPNRKAIYFEAERKLSDNHKNRTGVVFADKVEDWADQTCFLLPGNIYETVISLIWNLISNNPTNTKFFFIIDSMNALIPKGDQDKTFEEAKKIAGGAVLTSDFLRRCCLTMGAKGHYCFLISQVRATIKAQYVANDVAHLSSHSGSYALDHYAEYLFEFQPTLAADLIIDGKTEIGKYASVRLKKSNNDTSRRERIRYPIKYKKTKGSNVWRESEIIECLLGWQKITQGGAWMNLSDDLLPYFEGYDFPAKFFKQALLEFLDETPAVTDKLFIACKNLVFKGKLE